MRQPQQPWSAKDLRILRQSYPHRHSREVAALLGRPLHGVYVKAKALGIKKSARYLAALRADINSKLARAGAAHRYPKGHVPANKGLRRPGFHAGRMRDTQFKKGGFPVNHDPDFYVLGALRINSDGYIDMRVSFAPGATGWRPLHRILWQDAHGAIPRGMKLRFKDGDRLNVELANLELISDADQMRRNTIHNLPRPLKLAIHALGQLKRRIREKQDRRSA